MSLPTWHIAFRHHEVMNPSSPEKILRLGTRLSLDSGTRVLDLCAGTGGPAVLLAERFGCKVTCVDFHQPFLDHAQRRADNAGVAHLITLVHQDGAQYMAHAGDFDVAMCLGSAGVLGGFDPALAALRAIVPTGGHVAIGDLYRRDDVVLDAGESAPVWLTSAFADSEVLADRLHSMVRNGLAPITVIPSSEEDWMTYSSLMWLGVEDWLDENPHHPDASSKRERSYTADLLQHRLGWALIAGRRTRDLDALT